ncbi:MAG: hypothetical protein ACRCYQ_13425 [Nocardioides sp.]
MPTDTEAIRAKLRRVGLFCIGTGLLLVVIGLLGVVLSGDRDRLWMILVGIPFAAVGGRMVQLSHRRSRGMTAP